MKKLLLILIMSCSAFIASAQEETTESATPLNEDLVRFQLSATLAQYGYSSYSPTALLEAAKILSQIPTQPLQYESFEQEGESNAESQSKVREFTVTQLLADATEYADGDKVVLAVIKRFVPRDNHRGRSEGYGSVSSTINSFDTHTYNVKFNADEDAMIVLSGNGSTDLDLFIYNEDGILAGKSTDATDICQVTWKPKSAESAIIKIKNKGGNSNSYQMISF